MMRPEPTLGRRLPDNLHRSNRQDRPAILLNSGRNLPHRKVTPSSTVSWFAVGLLKRVNRTSGAKVTLPYLYSIPIPPVGPPVFWKKLPWPQIAKHEI
jgi:hypothetical protein